MLGCVVYRIVLFFLIKSHIAAVFCEDTAVNFLFLNMGAGASANKREHQNDDLYVSKSYLRSCVEVIS